ncbi:MAG: hypothetical protein JWM57_476 [Phycisphaerales bacterium]|nr:hypothetical protein [Phycisphaerales bacterium]
MRTFSGPQLQQISMPMGGIGAGCIGLSGHGGIVDIAIRNRPATTALADGHHFTAAAFGLIHVHGKTPVTKLLEGPLAPLTLYNQGLKAQGYRQGGFEGLPRFKKPVFHAAYPFGTVELTHPEVPLRVSVTGFNPFIPLDDVNSGLPCGILEYRFENTSDRPVKFDFSYHLSHWAEGRSGAKATRNELIDDIGVSFTNAEADDDTTYGSAALAVIGHTPRVKAMWARGGWFDAISALWREVSTGEFTPNAGSGDRPLDGRNGGSVMVPLTLAAGEVATVPVVIAWHFPNVGYVVGAPEQEPSQRGGVDGPTRKWRPFYVKHWADAAAVARHVQSNYASLRDRTRQFRDALDRSTVPPEVIDAVGSNLAILKSPTVLRQESGNVWAWEGCFVDTGCCPGTCTHVWNYAQAMPHLFPNLERTLREQEFERSMDERGHVQFRAALPDGPAPHDYHAAADGQLGGILKLFRDWQISGDRAWLARLYPLARRSLEYCIRTWDPDRRGTLAEPHHNTYDIEFWGPDGMCTSIYVAALSAATRMATELGDGENAAEYDRLSRAAAATFNDLLFNGEYFIQRVQWRELRDQSFAASIALPPKEDQILQICREEGPKYQYGNGCLSDGVIGAWMAGLYGVDTGMDRERIRSHLRSIVRYNFRDDLSDHVNLQRPGYALGHEPGLLLCTWPAGDKPTLPFVYSDEVWTGIEYQVAAHLISEDLVEEGLSLVRAVRSRYDGVVRNPFNEYECGSYYARALASYALLPALSGFRYDRPTATLRIAPKMPANSFTSFFSTATGYGTFTLSGDRLLIDLLEGELVVDRVVLSDDTVHLVEASNRVVTRASRWAL